MSDFSQNGIISNLHDFGTKSTKEIEIELKVRFPSRPRFVASGGRKCLKNKVPTPYEIGTLLIKLNDPSY